MVSNISECFDNKQKRSFYHSFFLKLFKLVSKTETFVILHNSPRFSMRLAQPDEAKPPSAPPNISVVRERLEDTIIS